MEQQYKMMMNSPVFKKAMRDAELYFEGKKQELEQLKGQKEMIQSEISRIMTGKPEHRSKTILKNVNGTLLLVSTTDFGDIKNVDPVKEFGQLSNNERTQLFETDKKMYKLLEHGLYHPKMTEHTIDLMVAENMKYEEFALLADTPQKPDLSGLTREEASDAVRKYTTALEDNKARLNAFRSDMEAYQKGKIQEDLRNVEEKIEAVKKELE
ncbi:hypothetical protein IHV10_07290 [Fictibacillus sp. 5RED26]|uniref:hypothetical protein n=1 Tax=Fictibacillus sp. 5RED26 TaxID=2745876 RepID=UPI0018CD724C|nr:hypothetical protein [Fictibacillus sp. 5RED26]MBH0156164.1 hypothetical protein [Fictibacillus sp. 5RED26]